jgi:hypothetical protein
MYHASDGSVSVSRTAICNKLHSSVYSIVCTNPVDFLAFLTAVTRCLVTVVVTPKIIGVCTCLERKWRHLFINSHKSGSRSAVGYTGEPIQIVRLSLAPNDMYTGWPRYFDPLRKNVMMPLNIVVGV